MRIASPSSGVCLLLLLYNKKILVLIQRCKTATSFLTVQGLATRSDSFRRFAGYRNVGHPWPVTCTILISANFQRIAFMTSRDLPFCLSDVRRLKEQSDTPKGFTPSAGRRLRLWQAYRAKKLLSTARGIQT